MGDENIFIYFILLIYFAIRNNIHNNCSHSKSSSWQPAAERKWKNLFILPSMICKAFLQGSQHWVLWWLCESLHPILNIRKMPAFKNTQNRSSKSIFNKRGIHRYERLHLMKHWVDSGGWASSSNWCMQKQKEEKSIEHAKLKNGEMIVAEKHHFMPILPWFHNVSYLFCCHCRRIKWRLTPPAKAFHPTNHSQTEKAIKQMQLAYKEEPHAQM